MIELRALSRSDIEVLNQLWQQHWSHESFPDLHNRIVDAVAFDVLTKEIVGYGQVKLFAEAMLFLDPTKPKRDRVRALRLLMRHALRGTHGADIDELYAFIKDPDFSLLIQKHYSFKRIIEPGELLLRRI